MKKIILLAILASSTLISGTSHASAPLCTGLDLRAAPVGETCATREGFEFTLVARQGSYEVWQDLATQALWGDRSEGFLTHADALAWCGSPESLPQRGNLGDRAWAIPSRADFALAESHGFREVLPNMPLRAVWTSTVYQPDPRFAYVFSGSLGTTTSVDMRDPKDAQGYWQGHHAFVMGRCMSAAQ